MQPSPGNLPWTAYATVAIGLINLVAVAISLTFAYRQIKKTHQWNRRKASQDLITQLVIGDVREMRHRLETGFGVDIHDPQQSYANTLAKLTTDADRAELRYTARILLNYFETIAVGIKNNILEEDICFDFAVNVVLAYWRWARPLVTEAQLHTPLTWNETENMVRTWTQRLDALLTQREQVARIPGQART